MGGTHLRCVSWTAVSSDPQAEKESLHDQKRLNYQLVENIGRHYPGYTAEVVADLQVVGSRSIIDIADAAEAYPEAYGRLLDLLRNQQIEAVVCRSRDRLGRVDSLIVTIERLCWKYGAIVIPRQSLPVTLDVAAIRDSEGAGLIAGIEGHIARSAVRRLNNEHEMGMIARVKRGNFAGRVPYGYKYVYSPDGARRVEIDQIAAGVLRRALLDMYVGQGMGTPSIADVLNAEGAASPEGSKWAHSTLWKILHSLDRYAGYVAVNQRTKRNRPLVQARGNHEAIISEEEMQAIKAEMERRSREHKHGYGLLQGAVLCSVTGKPMHVVTTKGYVVYRCHYCMKAGTYGHTIGEKKVLQALRAVVDRIAVMTDAPAVLKDRHGPQITRLTTEIADLRGQIDAHERKKKKLLRVFIYKDSSDIDFDAEMDSVSRKIADAATDIAKRERQIKELSDSLLAAEHADRIKKMGQSIMDRIDVDPDTAKGFLTQSFRVYVGEGERGGKITKVDIL